MSGHRLSGLIEVVGRGGAREMWGSISGAALLLLARPHGALSLGGHRGGVGGFQAATASLLGSWIAYRKAAATLAARSPSTYSSPGEVRAVRAMVARVSAASFIR